LEAVSATVNGEPVASGGVPEITPVVLLSVAQAGSPVALKVGVGEPVATTLYVPATPPRTKPSRRW
jgi:hypothetical protein